MKTSRLFWKFFLLFWFAHLFSLLIGLLFLHSHRTAPDRPRQEALQTLTRELLETRGVAAALPVLDSGRSMPDFELSLYDGQGQLLAGEPLEQHHVQRVHTPDGQEVLLVGATGAPRGFVPRPDPRVPIIAGTFTSLLFSAFIAWYLARPLLLLSSGLRSIADGGLATRVRPLMGDRRDELTDLAGEIDRMVGQLEHSISAQRRLLHDISHELRSPLTRLQVAIGLLRQVPDQKEVLERVERESVRLDALLEQVLTLSRLESGSDQRAFESCDLMELLADSVEDARFEAAAKHCLVDFDGPAAFPSVADAEILCRAFDNVLRNAVKYTSAHTTLRIRASAGGSPERLVVEVHDEGPGVAAERIDSIFQPFTRLPTPVPTEGFGLGLTIARHAVERHGGTISAHNASGGGLLVRIVLPRLPLSA